MYLLKKSVRFASLIFLSLSLIFLVNAPVTFAQNGAPANDAPAADSSAQAQAKDAASGNAGGGADAAAIDQGKNLFSQNCAACHAVSEEVVVGPGLKGITQRRTIDWLIPWVKNSQKVIQSGDKYAVDLYNKFNKAQMPAFSSFSDDDIKSIFAYITSAGQEASTANLQGGTLNQQQANSGAAQQGGAGVSSDLFIIVVVALLVVLLLVLIVLVMVVSVLTKTISNTPGGVEEKEFSKVDLGKVTRSTAFKAGAAILFILIAGKATIDGLYDVGVQQGYAPTQPIAFSHKLHAGQYQIQCRYCHTSVYQSKSANIPSANICMNCHNMIKRESPEIQKIYTAIEKDRPIEWVRVHNLPDFAYFNHSQHTNVGNIQCQQCHGQIEQMEVVQQRSSLTMGWCIDCHRKTNVNTAGNAYYDKLVALHKKHSNEPLKVANIGGLECSKCHY